MNKKLSKLFFIVLFTVSTIGSIYLITDTIHNPKNTNNSSVFPFSTPEYDNEEPEYSVDFSVIQDGLNDMGFLVTEEYYFTQVETYKNDPKKIAIFFTSQSSITFSYDGVVEAGVDFSQIEVTKDEDSKTIYVAIPDAEIHTTEIDQDSFKQYDEEDAFWNSLKLKDYNTSLKEFKKNAEKNALDKGILDKADKQAETVISNFIEKLVDTNEYTIEYK